jgi:hypothetical protein
MCYNFLCHVTEKRKSTHELMCLLKEVAYTLGKSNSEWIFKIVLTEWKFNGLVKWNQFNEAIN